MKKKNEYNDITNTSNTLFIRQLNSILKEKKIISRLEYHN